MHLPQPRKIRDQAETRALLGELDMSKGARPEPDLWPARGPGARAHGRQSRGAGRSDVGASPAPVWSASAFPA
jgi:hypothetical protein